MCVLYVVTMYMCLVVRDFPLPTHRHALSTPLTMLVVWCSPSC